MPSGKKTEQLFSVFVEFRREVFCCFRRSARRHSGNLFPLTGRGPVQNDGGALRRGHFGAALKAAGDEELLYPYVLKK